MSDERDSTGAARPDPTRAGQPGAVTPRPEGIETGRPRSDEAGRDRAGPGASQSEAPSQPPQSSLLSRGAIGFWFLGLGLLGLLRSWMRATRHGAFDADAITLLWLIGSLLLTLMGALRVWRTLREGPPRG
ncbi:MULTISPECIES: hypothetical protein [Lysobacter]|uniref:Transmembrane protein n=1 Tax=Lysobacter gummosus TaxID=262324 RepID=A0ABY3X6F2_9GAMM|nr:MULTISPECIES: hypothetical protein [Lysobacter]UJB20586.1 hypothetical protein L1A79_05775 [Lysobacter capsici]UJQ30300.1 hypothetical protein L2D09_09085 [Lysobacter gummosus]UNP28144.1 hypothetical protein MOV92_16785 [Lysobacter gummosus]